MARLLPVAGPTLLALALALLSLGEKSFWLDEATSISIAKLDWSTRFDVMFDSELNMAPYYVMLHYWLNIGGGEFAIRLLSVIFAVATVPLVYLLGKDLMGTRAGIAAALLLACNAFFIEFAQEARSYAFLGFMVTLSSYTFVHALKDPSRLKWGRLCPVRGCRRLRSFLRAAGHCGARGIPGFLASIAVASEGSLRKRCSDPCPSHSDVVSSLDFGRSAFGTSR